MGGNIFLFTVVTMFVFKKNRKYLGHPSLYNNYIFLLMIPVFLCLVSFFSSGFSKYLHIRKKEMFCLPKEGRMEGKKYFI